MDEIKINKGVKSNKPSIDSPNKKLKSNKPAEQKSVNKRTTTDRRNGATHIEHCDDGTTLSCCSAGAISGSVPKPKVDPKVVEKTVRQLEELKRLNKDHNDSFIV